MTALARSDDVRRQNRHLILRVLREQQQVSRTQIAELSGLSAATVSTISSDLIRQNILQTATDNEAANNSGRGRPRVNLKLNTTAGCIAVISLSMNHFSIDILDYTGTVKAQASGTLDTLKMSRQDWQHALTYQVNRLLSQGSTPGMPLRYIAVGVQGVVDIKAETMLWSPITPLLSLPLKAMLHEAFQVPVHVANDCNMIVEALLNQHSQQLGKDFAAIVLAQGIGMGLMLRGQRFIGRQSSAGEFGHLVYMPDGAACRCGQQGCIEAYAGDYAIWRRVRKHSQNTQAQAIFNPDELNPIIQRARQQEGIERTAYREAGQAIGYGLRSLFALIDPVPVAFVGHGVRAFDLIEPEIQQVLAPSGNQFNADPINFSCFEDAETLIQQGCALIALQALDQQFSQMES